MSNLQTLEDIKGLRGRRVFLRGALNVPTENGAITDDYRLQKLLPTINWLRQHGARIILAGHMSGNTENTFAPVFSYLREHFDLTFVTDYANGSAQEAIDAMQDGEIIILENLRQYEGEKANDPEFARMLAGYADIYVNDAFSASHREHASIVGLPTLLPAYAGRQFMEEYETLSTVLDPEHPFVFILGGAKFSTKLPLVEKFSSVADQVFVGGALANAYLAAGGQSVGSSVVPEEEFNLSGGLASAALKLPTDVLVLSADGATTIASADDVADDETIVDLGPETLEGIIAACREAKLVVWNGPLGWYEKGYSEATDKLAAALKKMAGKTILGGGDTAAVILDDTRPDDFSFVSTAGGAMITFLSQETLPGIEALQR
ncbi:MAG: phosphoglycerate kinase [Candidatus Paceibacterota bacterium]